MFCTSAKRRLTCIMEVITGRGRGIYKRIDENRELMELLERDRGPYFLERNSWVAGWLGTQDDFLEALRKAAGMPEKKPGGPLAGYPRPQPAYDGCHAGSAPQISEGEIRQRFEEISAIRRQLPFLVPEDAWRENRWIDGFLTRQSEFITKVAKAYGNGMSLPETQPGVPRASDGAIPGGHSTEDPKDGAN